MSLHATTARRACPALAIAAALCSAAHAAVVFETRAPGDAGGGQAIGTVFFSGHTFRLLERTHVTSLGAFISSFSSGSSVFASLYSLGTPHSIPDVVTDAALLDATLLDPPGGGASTVTGPVDLILEPGWYSFLVGTGRHAATAPNFAVALQNTGTAQSPDAFSLPYSVNSATNERTFADITSRLFLEGETIDPQPLPPGAFLFQTATRAASWSFSSLFINNSTFWGARFSVSQTVTIDSASAWLQKGNGSVFAAIIEVGPGGLPPAVGTQAFLDTVVGTALIDVGAGADEYSGDFAGLELEAGDYALVIGAGLFGATAASANIMEVNDQIVAPGTLVWTGSFWSYSETGLPTFRFAIEGAVASECQGDITGDDIVDFSDLNALLATFGASGTDLPADLDGSGTVDFSDLNEVLARFGTDCL